MSMFLQTVWHVLYRLQMVTRYLLPLVPKAFECLSLPLSLSPSTSNTHKHTHTHTHTNTHTCIHCSCTHSSPGWPTPTSTKGEGRAGCLCDRPEGQNDELPASRELHGSLAKALYSCSHTRLRFYIIIVSGPIWNYKPAEDAVPHRTQATVSLSSISVCNDTTLDVTKLCQCWSRRLLV